MCLVARVIHQISTDRPSDCILGVTSIDGELFVLLKRDDNQVAVYSINDYQLLRHLHLPGLKPSGLNDMTSCVQRKCLFASDSDGKCIHRYDLSRSSDVSAIMKRITSRTVTWSVPGSPSGLSVIPGSCNLLVAWDGLISRPKLVELRADSGQLVREITLDWSIVCLQHAVKLTTGQYVISHGYGYKDLYPVCMVDVEGRVIRCYGCQYGSDVGQLAVPRHLVVDEDSQFIFVADEDNYSVVLLSPTLEFVRHISEGVSRPERLYFHQKTRRLFVGQLGGGVVAIQL